MNISKVKPLISPNFYPFTLTKPLGDLQIGRFSLLQRWKEIIKRCTLKPSAYPLTFLPTTKLLDYVLLHKKLPSNLKLYCIALHTSIDFVKNIEKIIALDIALLHLQKKSFGIFPNTIVTSSPQNIFIEKDVVVRHCFLNTDNGPIYISKGCEIQEGVCLRGPIYIGKNTIVKMGATIYPNTIIGDNCLIGGEIKNSVIMNYSNKGHYGYLGDSIIGEWCNLGAGTSNSNIKNNASVVLVKLPSLQINAGIKMGLLMGHFSKSGINTSFNTGTVVGISSTIFSTDLTPKSIASFSWGVNGEKYNFEKAIKDIEKWMDFKGVQLKKKEITILKKIYNEKI